MSINRAISHTHFLSSTGKKNSGQFENDNKPLWGVIVSIYGIKCPGLSCDIRLEIL
jgi:hypothetical protein